MISMTISFAYDVMSNTITIFSVVLAVYVCFSLILFVIPTSYLVFNSDCMSVCRDIFDRSEPIDTTRDMSGTYRGDIIATNSWSSFLYSQLVAHGFKGKTIHGKSANMLMMSKFLFIPCGFIYSYPFMTADLIKTSYMGKESYALSYKWAFGHVVDHLRVLSDGDNAKYIGVMELFGKEACYFTLSKTDIL